MAIAGKAYTHSSLWQLSLWIEVLHAPHCTHNSRKSLLSLDLSHNHLSNLPSTLRTLTQLTTLRSLLLVGNPLTVSACIY